MIEGVIWLGLEVEIPDEAAALWEDEGDLG